MSQAPQIGLIHGWAMHGGLFADLRAAWPQAAWRRLDLPGHGRRRDVPWPDDPGWLSAEIAASVPAGNWLAGWSLGGLVAMQAVLSRPGYFRGLVLIAATPCFVRRRHWPHGIDSQPLDGMAAELAEAPELVLNRFFALEVHGSATARSDLRRLKRIALEYGPPTPGALARGLAYLAETDLSGRLGEFDLPVLLIGGARDRLVSKQALEETARRLPDARLERIPGAAHLPFVTHPARVAEHIREFIHAS